MPNKATPSIELVPWDFESKEHTERMFDQRVSCGWRSDEVEEWIRLCRAGTKCMYWAVLQDGLEDSNKLMALHIAGNPKEAEPIYDTAATQWKLQREPSSKPIRPIGHVALDLRSSTDQRLGLSSNTEERIVWVAGLYVSHPLQGRGIGMEVMRQVELLARQQSSLKATCMVLETMPREQYFTSLLIRQVYGSRGKMVPTVSVQEWYERQGYVEYAREDTGYKFEDPFTREKEDIQNLIMWKRFKSEDTSETA